MANEQGIVSSGRGGRNHDFSLQETSPCIDHGTDFYYWEGGFYYDWYFFEGDTLVDMTSDEYCGTAPDMGAFEYITEDCEECPDSIEGDTNFDGSVNILDIVIVANCILSDSCDICFDLNADGQLNILDLVVLVNLKSLPFSISVEEVFKKVSPSSADLLFREEAMLLAKRRLQEPDSIWL